MKAHSIFLALVLALFTNNSGISQTTYIDVLTAPAMMVYAGVIDNNQEKTNDKLNELKQAQGWISTQMTYANEIHNKLYRGLREVNGTLRNGLQVKRIYDNLAKVPSNLNTIYNEVKDAPEYSVFATRAGQTVTNKSTEIYSDVADLLMTGDLNLATSGDRRRLLGNIELNTRLLNVYLINMRLSIQRAKRKGFWKSINPFQTYVNTDKAIFQQIVRNSGRF